MPDPTRVLLPRRRAPLSAALVLGLTVLLVLPFCDRLVGSAGAHPGELDEYGGHFDERTGSYHYHRPKADMARRKREFLTWNAGQESGELRGTVVRVDRPDAVWLHIPYRPAYQDMARILSPSNRNDEQQWVLFWLAHVSPEGSAAFGKEYNAWFYKKVIYELDSKLRGQETTAQFRVLSAAGRIKGMLLREDENINLWMVLNGWSYYVLTGAPNPYHEQFVEAEAKARQNKAGLWERAQ
jgi:hypothetical protein